MSAAIHRRALAVTLTFLAGCSLVSKTELSDLEPADGGLCSDASAPGCAPVESDRCEDPTPITINANATAFTTPYRDDYQLSCAVDDGAPDLVFSFSASSPIDISLSTHGSDYDTVLGLRTTCDDASSEVACSNNANALGTSRLLIRSLPAGDYSIIVDGDTEFPSGNLQLTTGQVPAAAQRTCDNSLNVTNGSTAYGFTTSDMQDLQQGSCGGLNAPEEVYHFELATAATFTAHTLGSPLSVLYLRGVCNDSATELACTNLGQLEAMQLEPGLYSLFVDGPFNTIGSYRLVTFFGPPEP